MQETIRGEARALIELECLEHAPARPSKKLEIGVPHNHSPEMKRPQAIERFGDLSDPGSDIASPILGNQIEHSGPRLTLQLERLKVPEPPAQPIGARSVAQRDRHVLPRERVQLVPPPAH